MEAHETLDIVQLIDKNPLVRLEGVGDYQSRLVNRIRDRFNTQDQQLFVASFYCYLNYDTHRDFIIDLSTIWKWLGFGRINEAKRLLVKYFKQDRDYKILMRQAAKHDRTGGGLNKETIIMTVHTFKKLCLKARTTKADEIHEYFIALEEIVMDIVAEEAQGLVHKLAIKDNQLKQEKQENIFINFNEKPVVYIGFVHDNLIKFGYSNNIKQRVNRHKREINPNFTVEYIYESLYNREIECFIKENFKENIINKVINDKNQTELIQLNDKLGLKELDNKIREIKETVEKRELDKDKTYIIDALKSKLKTIEDENSHLKKENELFKKEIEELKFEVNKMENHKVIDIKTNSMLDLVDKNKKIKNAICMNFLVNYIAKQISISESTDIIIKILMDDLFDNYKKFRISSNFTEPIYNEIYEKRILTKNYQNIDGIRYILHGTDKKSYFQIHLNTIIEWIKNNCMIPNHYKSIFFEKNKYRTYNFRIIKDGDENLQQIHNFLIKIIIEHICYIDKTSKGNEIYRKIKPDVKNISILCKILGEKYLNFIISNGYSKRITMGEIYKVLLKIPGINEYRRVEHQKKRTIYIDIYITCKWIHDNINLPNDIKKLL